MNRWRKVWIGVKIALGVAVKLNDVGFIRVKELKTIPVSEVIEVIENIAKREK